MECEPPMGHEAPMKCEPPMAHDTPRGHGNAPARQTRALAYSIVGALCLFGSLVVAFAAFKMVKDNYPDYIQPFVSWLPNNDVACLAILAACGIALGVGLFLLLTRFWRMHRVLARFQPRRLLALLPLRFTWQDAAKAALVIAVLWAPIVIIMYPTGLTADTFNQLYQYQTSAPTYYNVSGTVVDAEFIDHHPVFDTLLYGLFWQMGCLVGSQNAGVFALAVLQSLVLAVELGALTCYLDRLGVPYALRLVSLVFLAWFPFLPHYAVTVLKDTTYLTVFIPWFLMWVEAVRTRGRALGSLRFLVVFMLLGGCCVITKKMGVFVLVACLIVLAAAMRGQRMRVALGGAATLLVFCLALPAVVYPAIGGVAPGGKQEVLGPAIQQVTALVREDANALTDEEKDICNNVFKLKEALRNYSPFISDGAKGAYRPEATDEDIARFLQVWATEGLKHPGTYLASTFETSGMLFVPFMKITYYSGDDLSDRAETYREVNPQFNVDIGQPPELVALNDYLEFNSVGSFLSDLPIVSLFFTEGFYGGWIPFIALIIALYARGMDARKKGRPYYLTALAPVLFCTLFLLVSPVASPRYILPQLFCTPLVLGWCYNCLLAIKQDGIGGLAGK